MTRDYGNRSQFTLVLYNLADNLDEILQRRSSQAILEVDLFIEIYLCYCWELDWGCVELALDTGELLACES